MESQNFRLHRDCPTRPCEKRRLAGVVVRGKAETLQPLPSALAAGRIVLFERAKRLHQPGWRKVLALDFGGGLEHLEVAPRLIGRPEYNDCLQRRTAGPFAFCLRHEDRVVLAQLEMNSRQPTDAFDRVSKLAVMFRGA